MKKKFAFLFVASMVTCIPQVNYLAASTPPPPTVTDYITSQSTVLTAGTELSNYDIRSQNLVGSQIVSNKFQRVLISESQLDQIEFTNSRFDHLQIGNSSLKNAKFLNSQFVNENYITTTDISGADFSSSRGGIYFRITLGENADFSNLNLGSSSFRNANLRNAIFRKSTGNGVVFDDADLTGADLTDSSFEFSSWNNVTCPNGKKQSSPCSIPTTKKKTIWCKKGSKKIKVSSSEPKCPRGYKKTTPPKQTVSTSPPKEKSRSTTCIQLRAIYSSAYFTSDAVKFETEMNKAVAIMRRIGWGMTADSIVRATIQGNRQVALGGILNYLRGYNCA
jgi:hypothetical protein